MHVVVCVKHVPDTEAPIRIRGDGRGVEESGLNFVMNYYDEHAVEEGLRIKERAGGSVTVITAGPARAVEALHHLGIARVLAAAIAPLPHDLVLCGKLATDDNASIVGPALAEYLGLPQATAVTALELGEGRATAHREVEGAVEVLEVTLPAVVTVERNINEPRYPSLPGIMKAKRTPITAKALADLGLAPDAAGGPHRVELVGLTPPPRRQPGRVIPGEPDAAVRELVRLLREEAKVL